MGVLHARARHRPRRVAPDGQVRRQQPPWQEVNGFLRVDARRFAKAMCGEASAAHEPPAPRVPPRPWPRVQEGLSLTQAYMRLKAMQCDCRPAAPAPASWCLGHQHHHQTNCRHLPGPDGDAGFVPPSSPTPPHRRSLPPPPRAPRHSAASEVDTYVEPPAATLGPHFKKVTCVDPKAPGEAGGAPPLGV